MLTRFAAQVNKRKGAETESAAAMEVEGDRAPQTEEERTAAGEARLRRVLGATPGQFKKSAHKLCAPRGSPLSVPR